MVDLSLLSQAIVKGDRDKAIRLTKEALQAGLRSGVKMVVGGAPVTQDYANYIGADGYAHDGGKAVVVCRQLLGK